MRPRAIHLLALLIALVVLVPFPAKAQNAGSVFQTALATEKSSYKLNEIVYTQLILYNPTPQRIAVHFSRGCWFNFVVRDMLGTLIHNETWPACDPDINGFENSTNVMTVDSGGGRWYSLHWNQLDSLGKHAPVPADYVLSWSFKNPDQPIPEASKTVTLTDQVQSQWEAFSAPAFRFLFTFSPLIFFLGLVGGTPLSRALKGTKRSARLMFLLPVIASTIMTGVILYGFYRNQLVCQAIQCPGTFSLLNSLNIFLLITPVVWVTFLLIGRIVSEKKIWLPLVSFEAWTGPMLIIAFSILNSAQEIWRNTFYYDWTLVWPSYALILANIPVQWIFYRAFKKKLLSTAPFIPVVKPPPWPTFPVKTNERAARTNERLS